MPTWDNSVPIWRPFGPDGLACNQYIPHGWRFVLPGEALMPGVDRIAFSSGGTEPYTTSVNDLAVIPPFDATATSGWKAQRTLSTLDRFRVIRPAPSDAYVYPTYAEFVAALRTLNFQHADMYPLIHAWEYAATVTVTRSPISWECGHLSRLFADDGSGGRGTSALCSTIYGTTTWIRCAPGVPHRFKEWSHINPDEVAIGHWRYSKPHWRPDQADLAVPSSITKRSTPDSPHRIELAKQVAVFFPKRVDPALERVQDGSAWYAEVLTPFKVKSDRGDLFSFTRGEHFVVHREGGTLLRLASVDDEFMGTHQVRLTIPHQSVALYRRESDPYGNGHYRVYVSGHKEFVLE